MNKVRIYLDNCCYNRPYDNQSLKAISLEAEAKLYVQDNIRNGKIELARFICLIPREGFDYTEWQRGL